MRHFKPKTIGVGAVGGGREVPVGGSGQGGCERRIEVIVKMQNKVGGQVRSGLRGGVGDGRGVGGWLVASLGVGVVVGYGDVNQE